MPAATRLNTLAERKRALILEADRCREAIATERQRVEDHCAVVRAQFANNGWWVGAAAAAGWLLPGSTGAMLRQLPALLEAQRVRQDGERGRAAGPPTAP